MIGMPLTFREKFLDVCCSDLRVATATAAAPSSDTGQIQLKADSKVSSNNGHYCERRTEHRAREYQQQ